MQTSVNDKSETKLKPMVGGWEHLRLGKRQSARKPWMCWKVKWAKWIMWKHHRNKENPICVESSQHFLYRHIHPIYYFLYLANQDSFRITALVHRKITTSSGLFARPTRLARQWTACPTLPWVWPSESKYTQIQKYTKTWHPSVQVNQNFNILQFTWASAMWVKCHHIH